MIVVLTTPRSGSTFICNRITKECGYKYVGEAFNFEYKKSTSDILNMVNSYRAENNVLLKIFPNNINTIVLNGCIKQADKVYVHNRKDFDAQCKSFYVSMTTKTWHATDLEERQIKYDPELYKIYQEYLMRSYMEIKRLMDQLNVAEVSYLEDFKNEGRKYQQPVVWDVEPPTVDFNVEKLFNG